MHRLWLALLLLPLMAFGHGALHDRIVELRAALAEHPGEARLYFELAAVYCEHGEWQPAIENIARVETLAPGQFPTDLVRGRSFNAAGRPVEARAALDRFLAAHPDDVAALVERARAFGVMDERDACLADYRAVLRVAPDANPDLVQEIAERLARFGCVDEAIAVLDAALRRLGPFPALLELALKLELSLWRFDDALRRIDTLRELAPRPEPWMAQRAAILAQAGRPAEARAAWEALLAHLDGLPNLERGSPPLLALAGQARAALTLLSAISLPGAASPTS